ncbi:hypothetical protein ABT282_08515 [Streptomyces sp. NPDC000927]|uniref:hypothetical protein n=1 Tax=Streptomyces sp. NPDC000927 TaxID=3154371 RepID=UPI003329DCE8
MSDREQRKYVRGPIADHWQIGIYQERGLLPDTDNLTWADVAIAHNEYYGCHPDSPICLHVDEDGRAYRLPGATR